MKLINLKNDELLIDKDTNEPIIIVYDLKDENNNSLKIRVKQGVKAAILEVFKNGGFIAQYDRTFVIEENAKLDYVKFQNLNKNSIFDFNYELNLKKNANLNMINFEFGLGSNINNYESNLKEENTNLNIYGLVKTYENTDSKSNFLTTHNASNTFSNVTYKHILHDKSKATFDAKSIVNENASFSKVLQNSNTLLLSEDAAIFARPHLEINIDELEASHGATTGTLDKNQLLYLQSRGIDKDKATQILLKAFENNIYDKIENSKIKEYIENKTKV